MVNLHRLSATYHQVYFGNVSRQKSESETKHARKII